MGNKEILFSHNFFWASRIIRSELLDYTQFFYEQSLDKVFHLNPKFGNSTIPKKTGAFNSMSCVWSIHALFSNSFVLSFSFHYERKTKAHFISYAKENGCWVVWCDQYLTVYCKRGIKTVKSINLLVIVWMISIVKSFKVILWPRPLLKWPNLKCHVGHMTHFE